LQGRGLGWQVGDLPYGEWDGAQEEDVVEGALVHQVEAGFVAMEQSQLGRGGELAEGSRDAGAGVTAGLGVQAASQELVFHGPGAAHPPVSSGHFLDHGLLNAIGGAEALQVLREEGFEALP
jgi:hypothetical protein